MSDPFKMLESDHRQVEQLLEQLAESEEGPERERLVTQLMAALRLHMEYEEQNIYPLTAQLVDQESADEAQIEHGLTRDGLDKLGQLVAAPGFGAAAAMLRGGIDHHVEEEESELFPALRDQVAADQQTQLARQLLAAKRTAGLLEQSLEQATKDQLVDLAQELGLTGIGSMKKDDLKEAVLTSMK
jgi:hemerythrin superfamily protein